MDYYGTDGDDVIDQTKLKVDDWSKIFGGAGNDTITITRAQVIGGAGNDTIIGVSNSFSSLMYFTSPKGVVVDIASGIAEDGFGTIDKFSNINSIHGTRFDDKFIGGKNNDEFWGDGGNDTFIGGGGTDQVVYWDTSKSEVKITYDEGTDTFTVKKNTSKGDTGTDILTGISSIKFNTTQNDVTTVSKYDLLTLFTPIVSIPVILSANAWVSQFKSGDFNGDGNVDFLIIQQLGVGEAAEPMLIFLGDGKGNLIESSASIFSTYPSMVNSGGGRTLIGDFNNDSVSDIFQLGFGLDAPPFPGGTNYLYLSDKSSNKLVDISSALTQTVQWNHGGSTGDVNGDGYIDVVVNSAKDGNFLQINDGTGHFINSPNLIPHPYINNVNVSNIASGLIDVNADGHFDLVLGEWDDYYKSSKNQVILNNGKGDFTKIPPIIFPDSNVYRPSVLDVKAIDLNGDKLPDLMIDVTSGGENERVPGTFSDTFYKTPYIQLLVNDGNGHFQDETKLRLPQDLVGHTSWIMSLSSVDFNHDGYSDILATSFGDIPSVAYLNCGDGTFYKYWESASGGISIAQDINNNGSSDIITSNIGSGTIQVYQNNLPNQHIYKPNFGGEKLLGSSENDTFYNGLGNDTLNGGDGIDTLVYAGVYAGNRENYEISQTSNGYKIVDKVGIGGTDIISNIEKLQFNDLKNYDINHKNTPPTGKLSVSGIASQGQILTAINDLADVDGLGSFTYQWLRDGKVILNAVEPTYKLTQADVQKNITVSVNYIDTLGSAESVISLPISNIENINDKPTGSVNIAGSAIQNKLLKVSNTLDDADGLGAIKYQWLRDGSDILNASQSSYTLTASDVGKKISVKAYYTDLLGTAESVNSAEVIPTGTTNQSPTGNAIIKGLSTWGTTLSITNTIKDADGIGKLSYTWHNDKGMLSTSPTYTLAKTDLSTKIWAIVSYTDKKANLEEVKSNVIDVTVSTKPSAVNDALTGTDGIDKLNGLAGNDTLIGGLGKDSLTGGVGADVFKFNSVNDSSALPKQADTITDFKHAQGDKIDLSGIDINPTLAGNQSFIPINAQTFSADATGKLTFDAKTSTLYGSTNSDPAAEFAIVLSGVKSLTADDFIL